jgi:hypothetical protein
MGSALLAERGSSQPGVSRAEPTRFCVQVTPWIAASRAVVEQLSQATANTEAFIRPV